MQIAKKFLSLALTAAVVAFSVPALLLGGSSVQAAGLPTFAVSPDVSTVNSAVILTVTFTVVTPLPQATDLFITWGPGTYGNGGSLTGTDISTTSGSGYITSATESNFGANGFDIELTTLSQTLPAGEVVTIVIGDAGGNRLTNPATAQNVPIYMTTSNGDLGAAFHYVADENDVQVSAVVTPTLSFVIRNTADNADQPNVGGASVGPNACNLGVLTTTGVNSCSYRLKVATNNATGYAVTLSTDGRLRNSIVSIGGIVDNVAFAAGTEAYGIQVFNAGSVTSGAAVTEDSAAPTTFATDTSPVSNAGVGLNNAAFYSAAGRNAPAGTDVTNTALVTHAAAASTSTAAGTYSMLMTYRVSLSF